MKKKKFEVEFESYGLYKGWSSGSKDIPEIFKFTNVVPAVLGTEFGYVLRIKNGKGCKITFKIEHPSFKNSDGLTAPTFTGELYVKTNNYLFFLGDEIWEPVNDKIGDWRLSTLIEGKTVAKKVFKVKKI